MKKILLALVLGLVILFPTYTEANNKQTTVSSESFDIKIHIEGWALSADAGDADGHIREIQIYNVNTGEMVAAQICEGYSCSISIAGLPSGLYVGVVIATNTIGKKQFYIG